MAAKKQTYEQAMKRLEEIVTRIDSNELDIDSLGESLKEAQELIKFCREKLYKADGEIKRVGGAGEERGAGRGRGGA